MTRQTASLANCGLLLAAPSATILTPKPIATTGQIPMQPAIAGSAASSSLPFEQHLSTADSATQLSEALNSIAGKAVEKTGNDRGNEQGREQNQHLTSQPGRHHGRLPLLRFCRKGHTHS